MNNKLDALLSEIVTAYAAFESQIKDTIASRNRADDFCFTGHLSGVDITVQNSPKSTITIFSGQHAFKRFLQKITYETACAQDLSYLDETIIKDELLPKLQEAISAFVLQEPYGNVYKPVVTVYFKCNMPAVNYPVTITDPAKQKEESDRLREFWVTDTYKECVPRSSIESMPGAYNFLLEDLLLAGTFTTAETIARLDTMWQIHNTAIKEAGGSCGIEKSNRQKMVRTLDEFIDQFGIDPPLYDKQTEFLVPTPEMLDFICYCLVCIIQYDSSYNVLHDKAVKTLKVLAKQKNPKAMQLLKVGTGVICEQDALQKSEWADCACNDIFKTVTLKIKDENEATYQYLLTYLMHLITETAFPKDYKISINTNEKEFLPIKGLPKSATHKFWVNCASYTALHPQIEAYVRAMMGNTKFYSDVDEDSDSKVGTGAYAVLALALALPEYAGLLRDYLHTNERYDSNILPESAIEAYLTKWGVTPHNLDTVLECLTWYDELSPKKADFSGFQSAEVLQALQQQTDLKEYLLQRIVDYTWKNKKGLEKAAKEADGAQKQGMLDLLARV